MDKSQIRFNVTKVQCVLSIMAEGVGPAFTICLTHKKVVALGNALRHALHSQIGESTPIRLGPVTAARVVRLDEALVGIAIHDRAEKVLRGESFTPAGITYMTSFGTDVASEMAENMMTWGGIMSKPTGATPSARERLENELRDLASLPCLIDVQTARAVALAHALDIEIVIERIDLTNVIADMALTRRILDTAI